LSVVTCSAIAKNDTSTSARTAAAFDSFDCRHNVCLRIVQNDALERIAIIVPRRPSQRPDRIRVSSFSPQTNAGRAEVDILGVVFIVEPRRKQAHDVHLCPAAVLHQVLHGRILAPILGYEFQQL
jgi:hypothetical protein